MRPEDTASPDSKIRSSEPPVAVLLGAALVGTADLLGRTVIAPAQLGAGLMTAVIGTPYFPHLLVRSRRTT
ncbi:ABC-type Fe3+-siderophore transport system permease subunit [Streptomyces sp. AK010]|nr:ABC-type Fe3+-siderophore transport system permease subunit [Streptomyces sp. AK010]